MTEYERAENGLNIGASMANTDSFIEEVNEELRRDRLFRLFRKWGWIPILLVLLIVGAAAWREYRVAQDRAAAQAFGDAVTAALDDNDAAARLAGLSEIAPASDGAEVLVTLLLAAERAAGDADAVAAAAADLRALAGREGLAPRYADLARLKAHLIAPLDFDAAMAELTQLARPGRPYRVLAMEQQALLQAANGDLEAAIALLRLLEEDSEATQDLQQRAAGLIVALESGATLVDPAPEPAQDAAGTEETEGATGQEAAPAPAEDPAATEETTPAEDGAETQ